MIEENKLLQLLLEMKDQMHQQGTLLHEVRDNQVEDRGLLHRMDERQAELLRQVALSNVKREEEFQALNSKIENLDHRVSNLENDMVEVKKELRNINDNIGNFEYDLSLYARKTNEHERLINRMTRNQAV